MERRVLVQLRAAVVRVPRASLSDGCDAIGVI